MAQLIGFRILEVTMKEFARDLCVDRDIDRVGRFDCCAGGREVAGGIGDAGGAACADVLWSHQARRRAGGCPARPSNRTRFRVVKTPNLPLWEDDHPNLLANLAAVRAKGGTVFSLQPEQWNALMALATDEERIVLPSRKVRATSQGYGLSATERKAVERYAQSMAEDHFLKLNYEVSDVSTTQPYDLHCTSGSQDLHVEVKGTTGERGTVFLTRNEVQHARENAGQVALYVVSRIVLDRSSEPPIASGGEVVIFHPWEIDRGTLAPLQFEYVLPSAEDKP